MNLLKAADRTRRHFTRILHPSGLTPQQYNVLRILRGAGHEGLPTLEIGERMIEEVPGVSRLVDRLVAQGYVHRERCSQDRRRVLCRVTKKALKILDELEDTVAQGDSDCFVQLNKQEKALLADLTARIQP